MENKNKFDRAKKNFEDGISFFVKQKYQEAEQSFCEALLDAPESSPTLENLAKIYLITNNLERAEKTLKFLISLNKKNDEVGYDLLLNLYIKQNRYFDLQKLNDLAWYKKKINKFEYLSNKLFYPRIFTSLDEIKKIREYFCNQIDQMLDDQNLPKLNINEKLLKPVNFELVFDGNDNFNLSKKLVNLYNKIYSQIKNISPSKKNNNDKIRIGFISEFFTDHSIMKFYEGIIYKINKEIFEVFVFHSNTTKNGLRKKKLEESVVVYNYENIDLPKDFDEKVKKIKNKSLDILFYTDIHLSTNLYYLTLIRLANIQITSIGHADTTGNPKIDYFISSKLLETEGYEKRYHEKVLLSDYLPVYYYKPKVLNELSKNDLRKKNLYFCPQNLIKILPDFDNVFKQILDKDKKAEIILIKDRSEIFNKLIFNRIKNTVNNKMNRIRFINRLTPPEFINFCGISSVILSTFPVGSGNTFYDSLYYGTPTITKPGSSPKNRIVAGGYKQMKIENAPVVNNFDDYIEKSIEIANLDNYNLKMHLKYRAEKYLFENDEAVRDLEKILISIV